MDTLNVFILIQLEVCIRLSRHIKAMGFVLIKRETVIETGGMNRIPHDFFAFLPLYHDILFKLLLGIQI